MTQPTPNALTWTLVVSVHNDLAVMEKNIGASPGKHDADEVLIQSGFATVSAAYNDAIERSRNDLVVFAHPDVYLPASWHPSLRESIASLDRLDPSWAVFGLFGRTGAGGNVGFTYSTGLGSFVGLPFESPEKARTVDEFVFAVRKSSGLRFDEALPGPQSQLCATDLCLEAERRGLGVYVIPAFAVHNSNGWSYLPLNFWKPYLFIRRKWRGVLPVNVPYARITPFCMPMIRNTLRSWNPLRRRSMRVSTRVDDISAFAERLCRATIRALHEPADRGRDANIPVPEHHA
jgi:hypothetical protein